MPPELHSTALPGEIRHGTGITAMDPTGGMRTAWAACGPWLGVDDKHDPWSVTEPVLPVEAPLDEPGQAFCSYLYLERAGTISSKSRERPELNALRTEGLMYRADALGPP
jgi:hypothetical protein